MARLTPLLTAMHRFDKSLSTWGSGMKAAARDAGAELWSNHDLAFYQRLVER